MTQERQAPDQDRENEPESQADRRGSPARGWVFAAFVAGSVMAFAIFGALWGLAVIVGIIVMIFFHELGHYMTARWAGMKVTEFFIGFGPRLWSFRRGEVEYGFKAVPAGAYVRVIGMSNLEDDIPPEDEVRTYRAKPYWRRLSVALAGSAMHFVMAFVLLFWLLAQFGVADRDTEDWTIRSVGADTPAGQVGLQPGDRIVAIDGRAPGAFAEFAEVLDDNPGREVTLTVARDGEVLTLSPRLAERNPVTGEPGGFLGIGPDFDVDLSPVAALGETFTTYGEVARQSVVGLASFFNPTNLGDYLGDVARSTPGGTVSATDEDAQNRLLSPVGAVRIATELTDSTGLEGFLVFFVQINIFIGIFNLVPLPPLDGGHVAVATYERVREAITGDRYRVDMRRLLPITYAVFMALIVLGLSALYLDLTSPISLG